MFERYPEQARRAIFFACYESFLQEAKEITPIYLLLGLSGEFGSLAEALRTRGEDTAKLRQIVGVTCSPPPKNKPRMTIPPAPLSQNSKIALARAGMEAESDQSVRIYPDHLLRALLCFENEATPALAVMGLELEGLRESSRRFRPWSLQGIAARIRFFLWRLRKSASRLIFRGLIGALATFLFIVLAEMVLAIMNRKF